MTSSADNGASQPVTCAGAVLLWPFLRTACARMSPSGDETEAGRALALNSFGVAPEVLDAPAGGLLRLLFGVSAGVRFDALPAPMPEALELRREMLRAVAAQWPGLGDTSPEGVWESFIVREGLLQTVGNDGADHLTVERKAYDILLDGLPWNLAIVNLPWMDRPLHVTWR